MQKTITMPGHHETKNNYGQYCNQSRNCVQLLYDPYSIPSIIKLDKKILTLHKRIRGLPNCISNVIAHLPYNLFGMEAFSLKKCLFKMH
jgi:hypothetical protein